MSPGLSSVSGSSTSPAVPASAAGSPASTAVDALVGRHGGGGVGARGLTVVRGVGARLEDDRGRTFIDCVGGQGSASLGHAHPALVAAIAR
ncbi:MAG: aminotransferase class III-fold pyridoxal phosphate-dependent enzyme, partial [Acidobacteriota bacterium]